MFGRLALLAALLLFPGPAIADPGLAALDAVHGAMLEIWSELPLAIRNVTLTADAPAGFGQFTPRDGNAYRPGETAHVYAELVGYGWRDNGDGTLSRPLDADLVLLDADGVAVAKRPGFLSTDVRTRERQLESYLAFDVTLSAFAPGAYMLHVVVHDRASGKDGSFEVPIVLVAPAGPSGGGVTPPTGSTSGSP